MALVQLDLGQRPSFSFGGTSTVVLLGGVSGLAGAALALVSAWVTRRLALRWRWLEYPLFGALLLLVTTRGLRGAPPASWWYFYLLVAIYGAALALITRRHRRTTATQSEQTPSRV